MTAIQTSTRTVVLTAVLGLALFAATIFTVERATLDQSLKERAAVCYISHLNVAGILDPGYEEDCSPLLER